MPLAHERVPIGDVARQVVAEVATAHPEREVRLVASDERIALVDPVRGAQLLANLVANAVEHGAADQPVDVDVRSADDRVRVTVTSRGRPIPADVMPRLFQPFSRGNGQRRGSGLGLGLHIASEVARAHGGSLSAESTPEGVTTFTVELPAGNRE
jgi:signal transduction histidine kinase